MKKTAVLLLAGLGLVLSSAQAADRRRMEIAEKKVSMCIGCHGIPGYRMAFPETFQVPKLGGQHPQYIVSALQAYKTGERDNATMRGIAATLSDQDMADIAAYYAAAK